MKNVKENTLKLKSFIFEAHHTIFDDNMLIILSFSVFRLGEFTACTVTSRVYSQIEEFEIYLVLWILFIWFKKNPYLSITLIFTIIIRYFFNVVWNILLLFLLQYEFKLQICVFKVHVKLAPCIGRNKANNQCLYWIFKTDPK